MKKIAIFCHKSCPTAIKTIKYFRENGIDISLVVIETEERKKFSASEQRFKTAHKEFNKIIAKSGTFDKELILKILWAALQLAYVP